MTADDFQEAIYWLTGNRNETKANERAGRFLQFGDKKVPEDEFLNGLTTGETFKKYGYNFSSESVVKAADGDKQLFEFTSSDGPKIEITVAGKIVREDGVEETKK